MKALIVAAALLLTTAGAQAQTNCLTYNKTATLTGTLVPRELEPGEPPRPEQVMLLVLDTPVCVSGKDEFDETVWEMQMRETCERRWTHVTRVRVTGDVFHAQTARDHTPVLIMAKRVERLGWRLPACKKT